MSINKRKRRMNFFCLGKMRSVSNTSRLVMAVVGCAMLIACESPDADSASHPSAEQALGRCTGTPVKCGDASNLIRSAVTSVKLKSNFVMIPRSAWDKHIEAAGNLATLQADNELRELAVRAASAANDPMASGVFGTEVFLAEHGEFTPSDILVVADDALLDPKSMSLIRFRGQVG